MQNYVIHVSELHLSLLDVHMTFIAELTEMGLSYDYKMGRR